MKDWNLKNKVGAIRFGKGLETTYYNKLKQYREVLKLKYRVKDSYVGRKKINGKGSQKGIFKATLGTAREADSLNGRTTLRSCIRTKRDGIKGRKNLFIVKLQTLIS